MGLFEASNSDRILLCVAASSEARAVLSGLGADRRWATREWDLLEAERGVDVVVTGVGKSNAAGATARVLDPARHRAVLSVGVCGVLPRDGVGCDPGDLGRIIIATGCAFADEGVRSDTGFADMGTLGFPPAPGLAGCVPVDPTVLERLCSISEERGVIATVSTCSGTDGLACEVARRTGARAEAMEGAAVGLVAHRMGVAMGEVRVVSNTTGSRTGQVWDLAGALARLSDVAARLPRALGLRDGGAGEA